MSKTQQQGTCRGCNTIQAVHEVGNVDPDLNTGSPEDAYLMNDHKHGDERCAGVDMPPLRMYVPQGAGKVNEPDQSEHDLQVDRYGDYAGAEDDDGYDDHRLGS